MYLNSEFFASIVSETLNLSSLVATIPGFHPGGLSSTPCWRPVIKINLFFFSISLSLFFLTCMRVKKNQLINCKKLGHEKRTPNEAFSIIQPLYLKKTTPLYPHPKYLSGIGILIWRQKIRDSAFVCP